MSLVVSIGATIGSALGVTSATTAAALAAGTATLGETVAAGVVGGTVLGSGLGAAKSAIAGEDVGKGALMGAATGAVGGGLAPGVGAAGAAAGPAGSTANLAGQVAAGGVTGAAANAAGAAVGGKPIGTAALIGGVTGGALAGLNAAGSSTGAAAPAAGTPDKAVDIALETQPTPLEALGTNISSMSGNQMLGNVGILGAAAMGENAINKKPEEVADVNPKLASGLTAAMPVSQIYQGGPMSGMAGIGMARGGQVPVRDGAYIIPADVVSALGNGSSKAGAEFLRRLMEEVKREAVGRHGLGAAQRAVA